jgi:TLC domain
MYTVNNRIHAILFTAELSTPLLNLRWILRWVAQYTGKAAPLALSLAFAVLFILSRVAL